MTLLYTTYSTCHSYMLRVYTVMHSCMTVQCHYGIAVDVHTPPIPSGASTCSCYYVTRGYTTQSTTTTTHTTQSYHLHII